MAGFEGETLGGQKEDKGPQAPVLIWWELVKGSGKGVKHPSPVRAPQRMVFGILLLLIVSFGILKIETLVNFQMKVYSTFLSK